MRDVARANLNDAGREALGDRLLTNHLAPLITDQGAAISWLTDRPEGKPTTSNCATLPFQR
ncbi:lipase family protein [Microbacterium sp. NPDC047426]